MLNRLANAAKTWVVVGVGALVLALAAFFVLSTSPDSTFAQAEGAIMYAENADAPVRTFSSKDPEDMGIHWDVTGVDADDFSISGGVLTFNDSPNFEDPTDRGYDANDNGDFTDDGDFAPDDNMYQITIRASEMRESGRMDRALSTETHVTVEVTNEPEDGTVTIDLRQPEVGTAIRAKITDPDLGLDNYDWTWYVSTVTNPVDDVETHWAAVTGTHLDQMTSSYTPNGIRARTPATGTAADEGKYLRAVVSYTDGSGTNREAIGVSEYPVRAEVSTDNDDDSNPENGSPGFEQGADYTRTVPENLGKGMNVGAPVIATDPNSTEPNDRGPYASNHNPSSDKLTYEIDHNTVRNDAAIPASDASYFSIDKTSGQLMVKKTLDWDMNGTPPDGKYMFYVRAIDPSGEEAHVEVTVTATDTNDAPTIMGSIATNGDAPDAPSEIRVLEQDSDDRDGNNQPDATYYGTPDGVMGAAGSAMGLPVALALGNQNVFTAPDEDERGQITWTLNGVDQDDFVLSQTNLSGSDEPVAIVFITPPDYENPTDADGDSVYKVTLVATDSGGLMDTRPVTIFVDNVAEQGMATLMATGNGIDQPTIGSEIVAMVEDPDGGVAVLTWQWQRSQTEAGLFEIIDRATAPEYTPEGVDNGYYLRAIATYIDTTSEMDDPDTGAIDERVQVSAAAAYTPSMGDGTLDTDNDKVFRVSVTSKYAVRVGPGGTPEQADMAFAMDSYELMLAENAEVGSIVGMYVRATGATSISYDLNATETDDDNYFMIGPYGQIRVKEIDFRLGRAGTIYPMEDTGLSMDDPGYPYGNYAPAMEDPVLDFEGNNVFRLVVTATDGEDPNRKARADVTIRLTDLNEWPYFDDASRVHVAGPIMYAEARVNRVVPLAATEPDGANLRWEVEGTDAADFEIRDAEDISGDGKDRVELHFKSQPNYEDPTDKLYAKEGMMDPAGNNMYKITVRAVEMTAVGGGPNLAAELDVDVIVTNSDEPGNVEVKWLQPEVNTPLPAALMDMDGKPGAMLPIVMANGDTEIMDAITWQWYRAKNSNPVLDPDATTLATDWEAISGANSMSYTPQATDQGWKLLVKADYADGQGAGKSAIGTTYMPVRADVHDDENNSPDFRHDTTARSVPEDTAVGANVGAPVEVDTNEDNDTLTYELDNDNDRTNDLLLSVDGVPTDITFFSIDKKTGQIMVAKPLDWDRRPSPSDDPDGKYEVWVRATDPSGEGVGVTDTTDPSYNEDNDHIKVTITATDVNEAPTVTGGLAEISIYEDSDKFVGLGYMQDGMMNSNNLYRRSDHDRVDSGRWSIGGDDGHLFEYSTPVGEEDIGRRLHFKKTNLPDYENPMDDNRDNVYELTLIVQDNEGLTGMKDVRITVMNVNEAGKLVLSPEQPHAGMPVTATLTDPDGVEIITDWKWAETSSRVDVFPNDGVIRWSTTGEHDNPMVGSFVWAMVDYRDGASVDDDPVTALDERNDDPDSNDMEHHKFQDPDDSTDMLYHNSDRMLEKGTDNAVRIDPAGDADPATPSLDVVMMDRMVYENVPSTGYVGISLGNYLSYHDGQGGFAARDTIGGPDVASFVFAEMYDNNMTQGYYDSMLVDPPTDDKFGQLAAAVATHFDAEGDKTEYIIEVTDPDAEVSVGPVRVTITVMNVNEAPTAPAEQKGGLSVTGRGNVMFDEIMDGETSPDLMVGTYRGIGVDADEAMWSLTGADMGDFSIGRTNGELMFRQAPDYEMPMDADTNNEYQITVEADDGTNTATLPVTVMVENVDEEGRVTFWRDDQDATDAAIMVGDELGGAVDDSDGNPDDTFPIAMYTRIDAANITSWQWSKSMTPDMMDSWMDIGTGGMYTVMDDDAGYYLRATAMYTDMEGSGKMESAMTAAAVDEDVTMPAGTLEMYDAVENGGNGNGSIDREEYQAAAEHYLRDTIDKETYQEVAELYLRG